MIRVALTVGENWQNLSKPLALTENIRLTIIQVNPQFLEARLPITSPFSHGLQLAIL